MNVGERIKSLRKAKRKYQEDLALDLGVSRQTINKWETNRVQPNIDNLIMLCAVFEVSSDYFLELEPQVGENEVVASIDSSATRRKRRVLIGFTIAIGFLFALSVFVSIIFGLVVFSSNTGDRVVVTDGVEIVGFSTAVIFSALFLVSEIILLIFVIKAANVNKS